MKPYFSSKWFLFTILPYFNNLNTKKILFLKKQQCKRICYIAAKKYKDMINNT